MFNFFVLLAIFALWSVQMPLQKQRNYSIVILSVLLVLCALRGNSVCADTQHYVDIYNYNLLGERFGPLYSIIDTLCRSLNGGPHMFLAIMALITYVPLIVLVNKIETPSLMVVVYILFPAFFMESFNLVRQSAAIIYLLLGYVCLNNNEVKKSIIPFAIALLLHKMAIIAVPFFLLYKLPISVKTSTILLVGSLFFGISISMTAYSSLLEQLTVLLSSNDGMSAGNIVSHYYENDELIGEWSIVGMLFNTLPLTLLCFVINVEECKGNSFYNFLLLGAIISNLFVSSAFCVRIASFFSISAVLAIPFAYNVLSQERKKMLFYCIALVFLVFVRKMWGYNIDPFSTGLLPYEMFFY